MMIAEFEPDYHGQGQISLDEATDQLLSNLQRSNANMRVTRSHERSRVAGQPALITEASNWGFRRNDDFVLKNRY